MAKFKLVFGVREIPESEQSHDKLWWEPAGFFDVLELSQTVVELDPKTLLATIPQRELARLPGISDKVIETIQCDYIRQFMQAAGEAMARVAAAKILERLKA